MLQKSKQVSKSLKRLRDVEKICDSIVNQVSKWEHISKQSNIESFYVCYAWRRSVSSLFLTYSLADGIFMENRL